ncbi:uncharacterized protein LOC110045080 [Orbicella faveolata]|uniref:uncharacterized protein LOC110045080 n=1 Tax=Orbicella faveolata TaxID=48498 RepID=UPI0009E65C8B|nr:uncharacterized protein LOC110045080 [Orbicella faveolata]
MMTTSWVAVLDKKEHKNWVTVGCALNITKNGIAPLIQGKMDAWYQSLISSPPLQSLPPCACAAGSSKCGTCIKWEMELKHHHKSGRPKICCDNSDRNQWGSPTGAWEIAKIFMPTLGTRKTHVIDAETTDIGGLLNLLEWCPFIHPPVSRTVLTSARDQCRNHWAHAPKQELQDADVNTIFGHLNSLLNDPVFSSDKDAQKSSKDLQDVKTNGLVSVIDSEAEALRLLRQSLVADLTKCRDDLDAETKNVAEVKEQSDSNSEEITKLSTEVINLQQKILTVSNIVEDFNRQLNVRDDLQGVCDLISEDVEYVKSGVQNVVMEQAIMKSQVPHLEQNLSSVTNQAATNRTAISGLQREVFEVKETLKAKPLQEQNIDDSEAICTAPARLTSFTGRETALAWLEQNLTPQHSRENCPGMSCFTKTVCGLGGCGKTSLAVEFAWKCKNCFPGGVFWINGESDENINKSVVENLALLNISGSTSEKVDDTLNRFLSFLSKKKQKWLLVVDNADELEDKTCPTGVKKICKGSWQRNGSIPKHGHILLTTRQTVKETKTFLKLSTGDCLELQCFSEKEGAVFLMQRTGVKGKALDQEAVNLVNELGAHPLALEQAVAYISALPIPCSFKTYLDEYRAVKLSLLEQQPATALSIEAHHRLSVHTTWLMNFEFVRDKSHAAATMMQIAAFLESEKVPIDVINPGLPELEQVELRKGARSEIDIAAILKVLSCYSLFSVDQQRRVFGVHKLVQEVVRESLTTSKRIEIMVAATRVLHFSLETTSNVEHCNSESANPSYLLNLSSMREQAKNVLTALLLNFRMLKNHMQEEIKLSKGDSIQAFVNERTLSLCAFACNLSRNNLSLLLLHAELSEFNLEVARMVRGDVDPNLVLEKMVQASIAKRNFSSPGSYVESKTLAEETVQKMSDFERSGFLISNETKYEVRRHSASYYAKEGQWAKNYKALLKLESLQVSKATTVELQTLIARAERFVSACNFETALKRYQRALQLAREVYPSDHPGLLVVLQHIATFLHGVGKEQEAKPYAEEMMDIAEKQPLDSDDYITGMTSALSVLSAFDASKSENRLLAILNERWPRIYKCVIDGCMEPSSVVIEDGSDDHAATVLQSLLQCFTVIISSFDSKCAEQNFAKEKGKLYLRIAQTLLSIRTKFYGEKHPGLKPSYLFLIRTHSFLGNEEQVIEFDKLMNQCEPEASTKFSQSIDGDYNVAIAGMLKGQANNFYKTGNYSNALALYNQMLDLSPNDAKLLTNRALTYMKLSQQPGQNSSQNISLALRDSKNAITADPSWVKGYYWKAVCLAHLDERGPSLAAAAVGQHLFPSEWTKIPAVEDRFGSCNVEVVTTVQELLQAIERRDTRSLVIVVKEGRYELPKPLKPRDNTVLVGLGEIQIICSQGIPLKVNKTVYVENITLSPSIESVSMLKEKAKGCLNRDQVDEALSLYSEALNSCPNDPQILTSRASTYLKSAEQKKAIPSERSLSLELAVNDAEAAIKADPSWLLGYYTKAVSLAELDRKQQALAAAAVFKHLSSGRRDIPEVTRRYGSVQIEVVESSVQLRSVLQQMKNPDGVNQVVLVKEGEYLLERTVEIPQAIVVAGQGKVKISCKIGAPFHFAQAGHVENVETFENCESQQESHDLISNETEGQSEVISLVTPPGYEHINSECKVN